MTEIIIVGGGPAGVAAALAARRFGASPILVERAALGGTCVHSGCIPAAAYHRVVSMLDYVDAAPALGVPIQKGGVEWPRMHTWAGSVVAKSATVTRAALRAAEVQITTGSARFTGPGRLEVGDRVFEDVPIVIATGAAAARQQALGPGQPRVITSEEAMALEGPPEKLLVKGSGRFSLEWADFFARLGSEVTVASPDPVLLPSEDGDLSGYLQMILEERGVRFQLGRAVDTGATVTVLVADERVPNTGSLNLEVAAVKLGEAGEVVVDSRCRTSAEHVFAAGDVTGPPWLSNRARAQGVVAAASALGRVAHFHPERIPRSVNTHPELAAVGLTEGEAERLGVAVGVGIAELAVSLRAMTLGADKGALKVVVDVGSGEILGAHMLGVGAVEVIAQVVSAMELEADYRDLARVNHIHPSLAELVIDALTAI